MKVLPINAIPNQQLSVLLDGNQWDINLKLTNGGISCSLSRNNEVIVQNARVVAGMRILQAKYQEAGNFAMICNDQAVPDYTQFGVTQFMVYISQAELDALAGTPQDKITADFFDPLGSLPLRFAPQGYILARTVTSHFTMAPSARLNARH